MKRRVALAVASLIGTTGIVVFYALPASAILGCPDGHTLVPATTEADRNKDEAGNNNQMVCRKVDADGNVITGGGPEDVQDDF
jgi:hypothetical protein